jgi:16S rRNA (cytosine967-C5)-methyltransferase
MQCTLLRQAALAVKPGGRVVYATCSSEPEENEEVVDAFLAGQRDFARTPIAGAPFAAFVDARGDFRTLPHRDGLEAFYAAVLTRTL